MSRVRVLVYAAAPDADPEAVSQAYHRVSRDLAGTPGLLGNELLHSLLAPGQFLVMSEWESVAAFRAWESGATHRGVTAPLRPFQRAEGGGSFALYEVAASY